MWAQSRTAIVMLVALTVVTGLIYPLVITGIAQIAFPSQANGSLIVKDGKAVGSALIGQPFDDPKYFWGRPSATSPFPNNAAASSGSNQGPTNPSLHAGGPGAGRGPARGRSGQHRAGAGGPRDGLGKRARPPHQPGGGALPGAARGAGAQAGPRRSCVRSSSGTSRGARSASSGEPRVNVLALNLALEGK